MPRRPDAGVALRLLVIAAVLIGAAAYLHAAAQPEEVPIRAPLSGLPNVVPGWVGTPAPEFDNAVVKVLGVDDYVTRVYTEAGGADEANASRPRHRIGLYAGYYSSQRQGDTIHSPMNCLPGAGWQPVETGTLAIDVQTAQPVAVNRVMIAKGDERQLVLYWYQGRGRVVASEYWSKAYSVWDAATRGRSDGALVRVISPLGRGEDAAVAEARAVAFTQAIFPSFSQFVPD